MQRLFTTIAITFLGSATLCLAQTTATTSTSIDKPKTKLETFIAQDGAVIVHGFSKVGTIRGLYGSSVLVQSQELTNPTNGKKEYGITLEVKETSRVARDHTSYIDYDEIESLIKGLDYISKIEKSVTKLDEFQADYKTRGDLRFSSFSNEGGAVMLAITSGKIGSTTAYFNKEDIAQVRTLLVSAKQKLDSIK
jgi:hypothetical protein